MNDFTSSVRRKYMHYCVNTEISFGLEILSKRAVSAEFRAIGPKLCKNCALSQNFYTRKLVEVLVI